jgi:phosphotransferase system HPr (HPr) family protein
MKAIQITVQWPEGLHMRAAAQLVKLARQFRSRISLRLGSQVADARSIMSIMLLCANLSSPLNIEISGDDEFEATQAVQAYFGGETADKDRA